MDNKTTDCRYCGHGVKRDIAGIGWQHATSAELNSTICFARVERERGVTSYCNCDTPMPSQKPKRPPETEAIKPKKPKLSPLA